MACPSVRQRFATLLGDAASAPSFAVPFFVSPLFARGRHLTLASSSPVLSSASPPSSAGAAEQPLSPAGAAALVAASPPPLIRNPLAAARHARAASDAPSPSGHGSPVAPTASDASPALSAGTCSPASTITCASPLVTASGSLAAPPSPALRPQPVLSGEGTVAMVAGSLAVPDLYAALVETLTDDAFVALHAVCPASGATAATSPSTVCFFRG